VANDANRGGRLNYLNPEWRRPVGSNGDIFCRRHSRRGRMEIPQVSGTSGES
jgi:hypothetical protein